MDYTFRKGGVIMNCNIDDKIEVYKEIEIMENDIIVLENEIKKLFKEKIIKQNKLMKLKKLLRV